MSEGNEAAQQPSELEIEQLVRRLVALRLDGLPRSMIDARIECVVGHLSDADRARVLSLAQDLRRRLKPKQRNQVRLR
jgi:hypothetical protein